MPEQTDDLMRRGYKIIQDAEHSRFGCDAVLLSDFCTVRKNETALDLGSGTGIIPILLAAKTGGAHFSGLEIQEKLADTSRRSIALNGLSEKIDIQTGDINDVKNIYEPSSFDVVTANPPYIRRNGGAINERIQIAASRHEILVDLRGVIAAAAWVLKNGGRLYMVHRPERLTEIINLFTEYKLEMKTLRFVQPYAGKRPSMALIGAVLNGKPNLTVLPPLVIYRDAGTYSDEITKIYCE